MNWYIHVLKNYAQFSGRARRQEFWMFLLINFLVSLALSFVLGLVGLDILAGLYTLAIFIPTIAVGARRLHDTGKSGWWQLIWLVPVIGWIALIFFLAQDSARGSNQYGENPKG